MNYKLGKWYESKNQVRADFGEYWKGILLSGKRTAVIFNYSGARRVHYGDTFNPGSGVVQYIGEGKSGDQVPNARNQRLLDLKDSGGPLELFLDCGDLFKPKKILYAGKWHVSGAVYRASGDRNIYVFDLVPSTMKIIEFLKFTFFDTQHRKFESELKSFAQARSKLYGDYPEVMRVRDNVIGEIGEYFAVKALNDKEKNPVIRLSSGIKNIDAVQIKNGRTYAIKTIGKIPQTSSNIWATKPEEAADDYVVVLMDHDKLMPVCVMRMRAQMAAKYMRDDRYQGSKKLAVTAEFARNAQVLMGSLPKAVRKLGR